MGVVVAVPYTKPIYGATFDSILYSKQPSDFFSFKRLWGWPIGEAREYFKNYVLETPKIKKLMFVDADATFHPDAIMRLYERDLPVVCGTMYTRELPPKPTIANLRLVKDGIKYYNAAQTCREIREHIQLHRLDENTQNAIVLPKTDQDIIEKDGCGMHFTMIDREVLEAVEEPAFVMGGKSKAGEDFDFCQKVQKAGFKIYWDRSVHTGHLVGEDQDMGIREFLVFDALVDDYEAFDWIVE